MSKIMSQVPVVNSELKARALPAIELKTGSINAASISATSVEIKLYNKASVKNCQTNCFLSDPSTFLMPTSFALLDDCAVLRFIKFTQASIMMNKAIAEKMYTYLISPNVVRKGEMIPAEYKCTLVNGCK